MLLKSRSRTHHPHMHYSYTRGRHKNMLVRSPVQINAPIFVAISQKFCCRKEAWGSAKVLHKKRKERVEKMDKCLRY